MLVNFLVLTILVVYSHEASMSKVNKITPSITNSFVNLGKVDIAFHIHKNEEIQPSPHKRSSFGSRHSGQDQCPCARNKQNPYSQLFNPSNLIKKMFASIDPILSSSCCDSHEVLQDTLIVDLDPMQMQNFIRQMRPSVPLRPSYSTNNYFPLDKPVSLPKMPTKSKSIDFFFLPPNRELRDFAQMESKLQKKDLIHAVGDKEKDFKNLKYQPHVNVKTSVKKDLHEQITKDTTVKAINTQLPVSKSSPTTVNISSTSFKPNANVI